MGMSLVLQKLGGRQFNLMMVKEENLRDYQT